jgi:hypothetical protein
LQPALEEIKNTLKIKGCKSLITLVSQWLQSLKRPWRGSPFACASRPRRAMTQWVTPHIRQRKCA